MYERKFLPEPNSDSEPFWDACNESRLLLQQCGACHEPQFYPRSLCAGCGASNLDWIEAGGQGEVVSFTIVRRAVTAAYDADAPYVVALIRLAEGPTMMSNLVECDIETLQVGMPVEVVFRAWGTADPDADSNEQSVSQKLPVFKPLPGD